MAESEVTQQVGAAPSGGVLVLLGAIGLPIVAIGYAILALRHPVVGSSVVGVAFLTLLLIVAILIFAAQRNPDLLDPLRLIAVYFLLIYCVNPLVGEELDWFFVSKRSDLVAGSGVFALVALIFLAVGYHLPVFQAFPRRWEPRSVRPPGALIAAYSLGLFVAGLAAYIALFVSAGGIEEIIAGEEQRTEFTKGIGWLLHASMFMFSGGALYFASQLTLRKRRAWLAAWPLAVASATFIVLQNRSRAFWAIAIALIVWHYQVRPLRVRKMAPYVVAMGVFFVFVGFARHPTIRPLLLTNPLGVVEEAAANFGELLQGHLGFSMNRLQQLMLAIDCYPDRADRWWGRTLISMFNPFFRLTGLGALQSQPLGGQFFHLAHPEMPSWVQNGYHPSLLGELLANYPWPIALFGAMAYGVAIRALYSSLIVKRRDYASLALYAAVFYGAASIVIWGFGSAIFRIAVIVAPILLAVPLVPRESARPAQNPWEAAPRGAEPAPPPRDGDPLHSSARR